MADPGQTRKLPAGLSSPAQRALAAAGIESQDDLMRFNEPEILTLHGIGPKPVRQLKTAMDAAGLEFAPEEE